MKEKADIQPGKVRTKDKVLGVKKSKTGDIVLNRLFCKTIVIAKRKKERKQVMRMELT